MCGIFGAAFGDFDPSADVGGALASLRHRGPDSVGVLALGDALFGHTRLRVIDLSEAAAQPMRSEDGLAMVTFNGEIYNHRALRQELVSRGHRFRTRSDTEVLLAGYAEWGERLPEHLDGMFAFALWDARWRRLLLCRDRAGEKPLFYHCDERTGVVRFASEMKALAQLGVQLVPRPAALPMVLGFGYVPAPDTIYEGILQLPPATRLLLSPGQQPRQQCYWQAPFMQEPRATLCTDARQQVRHLVTEAVRTRLEADVPVGAFLSGGIDSSIVVGVLSRLLRQPVKTFSIGFAGAPRFDETRYARAAAAAFGTEHTEFLVDPARLDVPALISELVWLHDGPFGDSSALPTYLVAKLTREHVTVALTGDGGDELFCGYERLVAAEAAEYAPPALLRWAGRLLERLGGARQGLAAAALSAREARGAAVIDRARRFLRGAALPLADRMAQWTSVFLMEVPGLLRPEWLARMDPGAPLSYLRDWFGSQPWASPLQRVLAHNFNTYLPYDLLVKVDRATMAHGLEARAPFLQPDLIEYVATLPDGFRRHGMFLKRVLREAFSDLLPPAILRRGKMGFGVPLSGWLRGALRECLHDYLGPGALLHEYLEPGMIARLLDEHQQGREDHGHRLWTLLTMEMWLCALPQWNRSCNAA